VQKAPISKEKAPVVEKHAKGLSLRLRRRISTRTRHLKKMPKHYGKECYNARYQNLAL
jgi:hypothetical protein